MVDIKTVKLSEDEQSFIRNYRQIEEVEREKGIKFFRCIGDQPHTEQFVAGIQAGRAKQIEDGKALLRECDINRYKPEVDKDFVVVDTSIGKELHDQPKWDKFDNNHFALRRRLVQIFLKVTNKLICSMRAGRRLTKIKYWIQGNKIKTRADMERKVAEDFKRAQNLRITDDGSNPMDNIQNIQFKFNFNEFAIRESMGKLALEYESNMASFLEKVETDPPCNFDDMVPFDTLEELDFEINAYKPLPLPPMSLYDPPFRKHAPKPGCEYESIVRRMAGEPDLERVQQEAHAQMELLKQDKKDVVSGAIVNMPAGFLKPVDYSVDLLLQAAQHPTLRQYVEQPKTSTTEVDPQFALFPAPRERSECLDEIQM